MLVMAIFFMETASMSVIHKTTTSNRRLDTVPLGWKVSKERTPSCPKGSREEIYAALNDDFREFANAWFGTNDLSQSVLYHNHQRRIDICFSQRRRPGTRV